jgi:hypothetical protein
MLCLRLDAKDSYFRISPKTSVLTVFNQGYQVGPDEIRRWVELTTNPIPGVNTLVLDCSPTAHQILDCLPRVFPNLVTLDVTSAFINNRFDENIDGYLKYLREICPNLTSIVSRGGGQFGWKKIFSDHDSFWSQV